MPAEKNKDLSAQSTGPDATECGAMAEVAVRDIEAGGASGTLPARLYTLQTAEKSDGLIVFLPCGGFAAVELDEVDDFARLLAAGTALHVLACAYTPSCLRPFPAAAEDVYAALEWTVKHRARLGWSGKRLVVAGMEAGGNLAAVAALMARDRGTPALSAQILITPMLDPGQTTCSMRSVDHDAAVLRAAGSCAAGYRAYLPRAVDRIHPYASPLHSSRMKGLAPALILSAQDDPLRDEAELYGTKLAQAGIPTVIRRLPPIEFGRPNARCECVLQKAVLEEITGFLKGLDGMTAVLPAVLPDKSA